MLGVLVVLLVTATGGVIMSVVRRHTGSIFASIGIHLGTNVVGLDRRHPRQPIADGGAVACTEEL